MEIKTKQRLVGILVLLALLAIFLPVLFHTSRPAVERRLSVVIPPRPKTPKVALSNANPPIAAVTAEKERMELSPRIKRPSEITRPANTATSVVEQAVPKKQAQLTKNATEEPAKPTTPVKKIEPASSSSQSKPVSEQRTLKALLQTPRAWVVQLGTFASKDNSDRLIAKLREKGFDAYVRPITKAKGKRLYRVYVGPEIRLDSAQKLREELQASYHLHGVVRKYKI